MGTGTSMKLNVNMDLLSAAWRNHSAVPISAPDTCTVPAPDKSVIDFCIDSDAIELVTDNPAAVVTGISCVSPCFLVFPCVLSVYRSWASVSCPPPPHLIFCVTDLT